jgi:anti-sigma-K factor RskA
MSNVVGTKPPAASTGSLIFEAQSVAKRLELQAKEDHGIERDAKFDKAIDARTKAAKGRFEKAQKDSSAAFWRTVGIVAAAVVLVAASVVTFGAADAREKAQAAHDRFRATIEDAKAMDQMMLRAFEKGLE